MLDISLCYFWDCWHYYLDTGDAETLRELYPKLRKLAAYFQRQRGKDGLLPVENLGTPNVWMDHDAYRRQRHKQCGYNLLAAAVFEHALPPLARLAGEDADARAFAREGRRFREAAARAFWCSKRKLFVNNLPWLKEEKQPRLCDLSLAFALLYGQCPGGQTRAALQTLVKPPVELGRSYLANSNWRLWALGAHGRMDVVLRELRRTWAAMDCVRLNNSIGELFKLRPDCVEQWGHDGVVPLFSLLWDMAGLRPLEPGYKRILVNPQLGGLKELELTVHTPHGPLLFAAEPTRGGHRVRLELPADCAGELRSGGGTVLAGGTTQQPLVKRAELSRGWKGAFYC